MHAVDTETVRCDWCRRELPLLDPETMDPVTADYEGSALVVHDDVYHPDDCWERAN